MTTDTTEAPRSLGRYELVHLLGQGGMGEVYLAKISGAAGFEKPCIVKTILPALLKDRQFLDRFHHEAKVLVHLVHSSIAQVYDMGEANGTYYMALEYVAGVDVAYLAEQARSQGQRIPVPVALYLGQKVAEGLGYAHRKAGPDGTPLGIVHRDVSPHNVMVSYEGEVKVIDFGLAKSAARSKYTLPATVMGKLGYMSPEQARAEPLDHRSDIYSCGVMVWELLAGRPLIAHGTVGEMMAAMANPTVPALHELRPDVDPSVDAVVRRALSPNPQDRYARSDDFARALNELLLRASSSLGAEEVGNFVKGLCPEAFSAQRKLISRISGVRRAPSTPPNAGVMPATGVSPLPASAEPMTGLEATSVRPLNELQPGSPGATLRPMVTPLPGASPGASMSGGAPATHPPALSGPAGVAQGVSASHVSPAPAAGFTRTRILGLALGLVVLVAGTTGATVHFMMRDQGPPPPAVAQHPMGPPPPPGGPPPPHVPGGLPPPGMPPPPPGMHPSGGPPPGGPPPVMEPPSDAPAPVVVGVSGSQAKDSTAPAVGTAGSAEVTPAVEKVPDTPAEPSSTPKKPTARPKPKAEYVVAKEVLLLRKGPDGTYSLPRRRAAGLEAGTELQVLGPDLGDGRRKVLGSAEVTKVRPLRGAELRLDTAATKAKGDRFVALSKELAEPPPELSEPQPPPPPAPPAPAPPKPLILLVKRVSLFGLNKAFAIHNGEGRILSQCVGMLSGRRRHQFSLSKKDEDNKFSESAFKRHADVPPLPEGRMRIQCAEGSADVLIQN